MSKAQDLPNDILTQIFQLAPKTAVLRCIGICKAWVTAALQVYYQELSLNAEVVKILNPILRPKKKTPREVSPHLDLVRHLKIYHWYGRTLTLHEFSRLLTCMRLLT